MKNKKHLHLGATEPTATSKFIARAMDGEPATFVIDHLIDLRLLCDVVGLDYAELDRKAYRNYANEKIVNRRLTGGSNHE